MFFHSYLSFDVITLDSHDLISQIFFTVNEHLLMFIYNKTKLSSTQFCHFKDVATEYLLLLLPQQYFCTFPLSTHMPLTIDQHLFKHIKAILYFFSFQSNRTEDLQTAIVRPKASYFVISHRLPRFVTCSLLFARIRKQTEKSKKK